MVYNAIMPQLFHVCLRLSKLDIFPSLSAEDHFFHYFSRAVHHYFFFLLMPRRYR